MSIKEFDSSFGITRSLDEEKKMFVNRLDKIYDYFKSRYEYTDYKHFFELVCYELGENPKEVISKSTSGMLRPRPVPSLKVLAGDNFYMNLRLVVAIFYTLRSHAHAQKLVNQIVVDALEKSMTDLGVKWADGVFYPSGEELLDRELVEQSLNCLQSYPNENKDLRIALENYFSGRLHGVVENCYLAVEGLARQLLSNRQTLLNNKPDLLRLLGFSRYWGNIISAYIDYANEFRRHAGDERHNLQPSEVEGFLYLTCLVIRLVLQKQSSDSGAE